METKNIELQKTQNYHYVFAGFTTFDEVLKKMKEKMPYYKISLKEKKIIKEVFYDNEYNMLSDAGIVLSKSTTKKDSYFYLRRLNRVLKKKNTKYRLENKCDPDDHPRDYAVKIANAIDNSFSSSLTIDLESIVKKTKEIIEVINKKAIYDIICGSGYRAQIVFEDVSYKDIESGKKVFQEGVTLTVPTGENQETTEILKIIERNIPGLVLYEESRFEIAQKLLYTEEQELELPTEGEEEN